MTTDVELKAIEKMTADELREELAAAGIVLDGKKPKVELVDLVEQLRASRDGEPVEDAEPVAGEVVAEDDTAYVPQEVADEVGQALELREQSPEPVTALPSPQEFNAALAIANQIARTSFVPAAYRGKPDDVLAAILFGREIGLGPMTAMRDVHMIDGRPALAAHRQLALLRSGGVVILESESNAEHAIIRARRSDTGEVMTVSFTMDEAKQVKRKGKLLVDGDNWRSYPADMLWARCVGRLTRRLGPDLLNGLPPYVAEEVADFSGWGTDYGEGGDLHLSPNAPTHTRADSEMQPPRTWAAINAIASHYGPEIGWAEWVKDAAEILYGERESAGLTVEQRTVLGQKAGGAIVALRESHDPGGFPPVDRKALQDAWAKVLAGEVLPGPAWRMGPDEPDLPTYYEATGTEPPAEPPVSPQEAPGGDGTIPTDPEAEQIPFGEEGAYE